MNLKLLYVSIAVQVGQIHYLYIAFGGMHVFSTYMIMNSWSDSK
ncbi:putative membrane protein [Anaplasma phagocytophilum str. ApMUC09]|uniref:Putative membrane protein n=1 Tax=Anaplasma phagocytophilum str. ApMUC09 TaxID=1359152 RepID=A0A0F3N8Z0_ANAPH|nr:putative membrane protein [Anaplasma phagocytophilum str. ApMUC09]